MTRDSITHEPIEEERFELRAGPAYTFAPNRRQFVQVLGAGECLRERGLINDACGGPAADACKKVGVRAVQIDFRVASPATGVNGLATKQRRVHVRDRLAAIQPAVGGNLSRRRASPAVTNRTAEFVGWM